MNKISKNIFKYLIEIVIVAFGVFLGVYFSNLNSEIKTDQEKERTIQLILNELRFNEELLEEQIVYHNKIKIQYDSILKTLTDDTKNLNFASDNISKIPKINEWEGFKYALMENTAFEGAKLSGIMKEFDVEIIQKLSSTYNTQNFYLKLGEKIVDKALEIDSSSKISDLFSAIDLMTNDLSGYEKKVKEKVSRTISELEVNSTI